MTDEDSPYTEFATDCYYLWQAGTVYLPLAADTYGRAAGLLGGSPADESTLGDAFTRAGSTIQQDNVDVHGVIYPAYIAMRNDVSTAFSRISDRLYRVGEALEATAWAFAEQDTDNSNDIGTVTDQLDSQIGDREKQIADDKETNNPDILPERPDKDDLSDPHLHEYDEHLLPSDAYPEGDKS